MKSITYVITGLNPGGAEAQAVEIAIRFKKKGWNVGVISIIPGGLLSKKLIEEKILYKSLNIRKKTFNPFLIFFIIIKLVKILKDWKPDIVHSHMFHANIISRISKIFYPKAIFISTIHSVYEGPRWRDYVYRLTDSFSDITTTISKIILEEKIRKKIVPRNKITLIHNGVDINRFSPNNHISNTMRKSLRLNNEFVWLAVGRFEKPKDYKNMIKAFKIVLEKFENAKLLIVGKGPLLNYYKNLVNVLNMEKSVIFLGYRSDISNLMNSADAYVMSSAWEGLPLVLLEAGACGLPIVATDVGGNSEIVINNKNGYLVPPKNSESLAQAMIKIMNLEKLKFKKMKIESRNHIVNLFNIEIIISIWEKLYGQLLINK
ncbi:MAG: glycosyltransferase [Promethearchaeota archaeon]